MVYIDVFMTFNFWNRLSERNKKVGNPVEIITLKNVIISTGFFMMPYSHKEKLIVF